MIALIFSLLIRSSSADPCTDGFRKVLFALSEQAGADAHFEYAQYRLKTIYQDLYSLGVSPEEEINLTRTLEFLELQNNKKQLFSDMEKQFSTAYSVFVKKGRDPIYLHDYFRALVRGDRESAMETADLLLSSFEEGKRATITQYFGIYPKDHPFWKNYQKPIEVKTSLISYTDEKNDHVMGIKVDVDRWEKEKKTRMEKFAQGMEDLHGVTIASVPQAIEKLGANGFSKTDTEYLNLEVKGSEPVKSPMIVIPEDNIEFDKISSTSKHEARHAYYNTQRKQKSSTAFDSSVVSINKQPLGVAVGYQNYQSYEEVSTHSRDLMDSFRTGNREILNLYKSNPVLSANHVLDFGYTDSKAKVVKNISEQTVKTADQAIAEIEKMKSSDMKKVKFIIDPTEQGYLTEFPVNDSFYMRTYLSSKSEKAAAKKFIDDYNIYADALAESKKTGVVIDATLEQRMFEEFKATLTIISEKISRTRVIAKETAKDADAIISLMDSFYSGHSLALTKNQYLEIRNLISKPAHRVTGLTIRDPEEYIKAHEAARAKRKIRHESH